MRKRMKKAVSLLCVATMLTGSVAQPVFVKTNVICAESSMVTSDRGINLIKEFEGFRSTAYKVTDSEKYYTIGYGHYGADVTLDMIVTEEEAVELLRKDVGTAEKQVNDFLNKNNLVVTQNQFDALVSFTFNLGNVWIRSGTVTLRDYLINGIDNYTDQQITDAFGLWCKSGGKVLQGLVRRRKAEADLFLEGRNPVITQAPTEAPTQVPTPVATETPELPSPTEKPVNEQTQQPTVTSGSEITTTPDIVVTQTPSEQETSTPIPTEQVIEVPTEQPVAPTTAPTAVPTERPVVPTTAPTETPTQVPVVTASAVPSAQPVSNENGTEPALEKEETKKQEALEKGDTFEYGNGIYKVTKAEGKNIQLTFTGLVDDEVSAVTIPTKFVRSKQNCKVTVINKKALRKNTSITSLLIGSNVEKIGKEAFYGCKNLKTIEIKSKKISQIEKKALKGVTASLTLEGNKKQKSRIQNLCKQAGLRVR